MPFKRFLFYISVILVLGFAVWFFLLSPTSKPINPAINSIATDTSNLIENLVVLIFKQEQKMELWSNKKEGFQHLKTSSIKTFSKHTGTKIYANQPHTPEGIYHINSIDSIDSIDSIGNIVLNFPNDFDIAKMFADKRQELFTPFSLSLRASEHSIELSKEDMMILKNIVKKMDLNKVQIFIFPNDARTSKQFITCYQCPHWIPELYGNLLLHLDDFSNQTTSDSTKSLN